MMFIAGLLMVPAVPSAVMAQQEQIAGGYAETSNNDPGALAAARFAVRREAQKTHKRITFRAIKRAEVQVVAGLNYRLCLSVRIGRKTQEVTVVVYKNLNKQYSLTSWTAGCVKQ
jgi:hypothetical protein